MKPDFVHRLCCTILCILLIAACSREPAEVAVPEQRPGAGEAFDIILRGGTVYDGLGGSPWVGDVALDGDRIVKMGDLADAQAVRIIDVTGLAVAPGFINMLSWAVESLIEDGRAMSDIKQGVTLEVFGEGWSMGPWTEAMAAEALQRQGDIRFDIEWATLGEYLEYLGESWCIAKRGFLRGCDNIAHPRSWL